MAASTAAAAAAEGTALEDLPEDALLSILALLAPPDAATAACACRRLAAAASSPALPLALALRLGLPPPLPLLLPSPDAARRLLRSLHRLRRLRGLWRRLPSSNSSNAQSPSLAAFEWAPRATLAASLLAPTPAPIPHGLAVSKSPFVTISIAESGDTVTTLGDVPACVNFVGDNHIVVEAATAASGEEEDEGTEEGSPPEEMYMHFANRRSPGAGRRRRGRQGRRRGGWMEAEHFVRIPDAEPTEARPLQGLWKHGTKDWRMEMLVSLDCVIVQKVNKFHPVLTKYLVYKSHFITGSRFYPQASMDCWFVMLMKSCELGICGNRTLEFFLVTYDDIGGLTCRQVSDTRGQNSGYSPVFWTTNTTFHGPPFSEEELDHYCGREHIQGVASCHTGAENRVVSRILWINSSHDIVDHHLSAPVGDTRNVEGRIWLYEDGTFGFGFTGSNSIIDLKHVSLDGCILDT